MFLHRWLELLVPLQMQLTFASIDTIVIQIVTLVNFEYSMRIEMCFADHAWMPEFDSLGLFHLILLVHQRTILMAKESSGLMVNFQS